MSSSGTLKCTSLQHLPQNTNLLMSTLCPAQQHPFYLKKVKFVLAAWLTTECFKILVITTCLKSDYSHRFSDSSWWLLLVWRVNILTISAMQIDDCCLFEDWTFWPFQRFTLVTTTCLRREHSHCFSDSSWWLLLVWRESWDIPGQKRGWTTPRAQLADLRTTGTRGHKETGTSPGSPLTFLT